MNKIQKIFWINYQIKGILVKMYIKIGKQREANGNSTEKYKKNKKCLRRNKICARIINAEKIKRT